MAKKERNRGSVDRARAKRATAPNPAGEPSFRRFIVEDTPATPEPASTRPTPRPARGSNLAPTSTRDKPVPRPSTVEERAAAERADRAAKREAREAESLMKRAVGGKVKKMEMGGMCRGMGAATKGGNFRMG
jgi:hypothetical protein